VRYAADANVYVRSHRAGKRVMSLLRKLYAKLRLRVNETKSAVASVFGRKFLGISFWVDRGGEVKCKVADKPLATFKQRIRQLASPAVAQSVAALSRRWWHNSLSAIHHVLTIAYFDRLGVPRLS